MNLHDRNKAEIGQHVNDLRGNYLGKIVGGSIETGRWIVRRPDGSTGEYEGPQMVAADNPPKS